MKKPSMLFLIIACTLLFWGLLTLFVQYSGGEKSFSFGSKNAQKSALIYYHPDPFYNLDEQVCKSFAEGLVENDWLVQILTVDAAQKAGNHEAELIVFCTNTYNFAPDRPISNFIKNHTSLSGKNVVAITLGAGTTGMAHRIHKDNLENAGANIIAEKELWLMRPNDEERQEESNILVAKNLAKELAATIK